MVASRASRWTSTNIAASRATARRRDQLIQNVVGCNGKIFMKRLSLHEWCQRVSWLGNIYEECS